MVYGDGDGDGCGDGEDMNCESGFVWMVRLVDGGVVGGRGGGSGHIGGIAIGFRSRVMPHRHRRQIDR